MSQIPAKLHLRSVVVIALAASLFLPLAAADQIQLNSPPSGEIPREFFGLHIHRAFSTTPWPPVPFGSWRLWGSYVRWPQLEPARNQWRWETLDREVELGEKHHVNLLLPLGEAPDWASPGLSGWFKGGSAPADIADINDWRTLVKTLATRYKGRIMYYELWNEPNLPKSRGDCTPENMLILAREAYTIFKQVDPNIKVITPAPINYDGIRWMDHYLELGGGKYADIISYHFYVKDRPEAMLDLILPMKQMMQKYGLSDKPLWDTEAGFIKRMTGPIDQQRQAPGWAARAYILNWAAGVQRYYWYAWDDDGADSVPFTEEDESTITASARAYAEVQKWLVGSRMQSCESDASKNWVCKLTRDSGANAWILWNEDRTTKYDIPKTWAVQRATKLSGEESAWTGTQVDLSELPIMLQSSAAHH